MNNERIEVCGIMTSGKTTLVRLFEKNGFGAFYERYWENPFVNAFYLDKSEECVFETEMVFTLLHYNGIRNNRAVCYDYSLLQDLSYSEINLTGNHAAIYKEFYDSLMNEIQMPKYLIYLKCDVETAMIRLKKRGRHMEQEIPVEYLQKIKEKLEEKVLEHPNLLIIDSEKVNFLAEEEAVMKIVKKYLCS